MERRIGERIETPIDTNRRRHEGTKARSHKGTKARRHDGTKARRHEGTKARRHEGIEALSTKETARKREKRKYKEIETQRNVKKLRGKEYQIKVRKGFGWTSAKIHHLFEIAWEYLREH